MKNFIDNTTKIGKGCTLGYNIIILENVHIGNNVTIGHNTVIYPNSRIGDNVEVQCNTVIGKQPKTSVISTRKVKELMHALTIGNDSLIGCSCVIYAGTKIGEKCMVGDLASIREKCEIGDSTIIGRAVTVEYETKIGNNTKIQTACHITGNMTIEDNVFFGPEVTTMNDRYMDRIGEPLGGPHIKKGARIGGNATILPGIMIGKDAIVGAGSVVTKNVNDYTIVVGVPAKPIKIVPTEQRLP